MFTRRFSNALLISLIVHLVVLLAFTQQGTIGAIGRVREERKAEKGEKERKEEKKIVEVEFARKFMLSEPVAEAVERYALKKLAIAAPVERPVAEALTRAETIEFIPEAIASAPAEVPRGVITTTRPPTYGGGGGLPIAKFVQSMSYVPPTTTAIQYSGPGMTLALARPGMNIRVPAGLPVTRGTSPGYGPGRIPGVGGIGPGSIGIGRGVGLPTARIAKFAPAKVGGEGISIGGLAGELSEAELFGLSDEPGAIIMGRGKDIRGYFHIMRVRYSFGDFYTDPTCIPNLVDWVNRHTNIKMKIVGNFVRFTDKELLKNPFLFIAGHQYFSFSEEERRALRNYLFAGGFLYSDDCNWQFGNPYDVCMRAELRAALGAIYNKLYYIPPGGQELLHAYYDFDQPPIGHDGAYGQVKYPFVQAINIPDNRIAVIISNRDHSCTMEDPAVHGTYFPRTFQWMINVIVYVLTTSPLVNAKDYIRE